MQPNTSPSPIGTDAETRSHPWVIVLCMFITVIEGFNLIVYGSVIPLLLDDTALGLTDQTTGLIGGLVYIGAIVGSVAAPWAADRLGRKRVLLFAIALFAAGAVLTGSAISVPMLAAARFVTGIGIGGSLTTAMTAARNSSSARRASLVVTITMAGIPLGGVVASLLAIPILPAFGWRPMFFVGASTALAIMVAVALMTIPTDTPQEIAGRLWSTGRKLRVMFVGRGLVATLVIAACAIANMVAWQGLNVWATQAMVDLGYSLRVALLLTFTLTGAAVAGSFVAAWAADRRGSSIVAVATSSCTFVGLVGILVLPLSLPGTIACVALTGLGGHSTMNLVHTTTADIFPLSVRATALGWSNGTSFIGAFAGPVLGGTAIAAGGAHELLSVFASSAAVCVVAVLGLVWAGRTSAADASVQRVIPEADPMRGLTRRKASTARSNFSRNRAVGSTIDTA
ncbi:aromatic acid/H+ symport family MFS transporter [Rhodococcus sp. G-MC3]|uniref:MFS transporter n=1 Tax=Rhodococcus sp. G-MC3 TaxID=3046209 RepID=UPI0024B88A22|nr:aromatic acid/H+ symport family MFS transporter [Rhodococcus sp. G-MC3]MDJ0396389.1 aromatic acid/H+ symport family MFS transporter [Rhodococcus sp. G-MC3]